MKKILLISGSFLLLAGCSMMTPAILPTQTVFEIPADKYEILSGKEVTGMAEVYWILCFFGGDAGLNAAYEDALSKSTWANALMNVKVDQKYFTFFGWCGYYRIYVTGLPVRILIKPSGRFKDDISIKVTE